MELVHEVFRNELGHVHHVSRVAKHWQVNFITEGVQVLEDLPVNLHEENFLGAVLLVNVHLLAITARLVNTLTEHDFLLDLVKSWHLKLELDLVGTCWDGEQVHGLAAWLKEPFEQSSE